MNLTDLSDFKYKRRYSVFKKETNNSKFNGESETSSDEESAPTKRRRIVESVEEDVEKETFEVDNAELSDAESITVSALEGESTPQSSRSSSKDKNTWVDARVADEDDANYKLEILKGVFKDAYSETLLVDAASDTSGLEHALSVLLRSPMRDGTGINIVKFLPTWKLTCIVFHVEMGGRGPIPN